MRQFPRREKNGASPDKNVCNHETAKNSSDHSESSSFSSSSGSSWYVGAPQVIVPYRADAQKLPQHVSKNKTGYTALSNYEKAEKQKYHKCISDVPPDGQTDGWIDGRTDRPMGGPS